MAISYPRDLPSPLDTARSRFHCPELGDLSRSAGGAVAFHEQVGGSLWDALFVTPPVNQVNFAVWHAFWLSIVGKTFKGYDPSQPYPLYYGAGVLNLTAFGGGSFDGTCRVTAAGGGTISLDHLPANYHLSLGDYISFPWFGKQRLVKALESVVGNGSGVLSNLAVAPWMFAGGSVPATAVLVKAWCLMVPKPGTWSAERSTAPGEPVSFEAIQTLA